MKGWIRCSLGELIELKRGYDLPRAQRKKGNIPIISSSGNNGFHSQAKVNSPGVITGRYGTVGEVFFSDCPFWPLNTTLYIRDFKGNNPKFCFYFLKTLSWDQFNDKSGVPGVNRNDVHKEHVHFPPLPEQREIAAILGALDDKIENNRKTAATLEEMARALYRSWFVNFDPVHARAEGRAPAHMDAATAALFPDRFGEDGLPEGWITSTIGSVANIVGGSTPSTKNDIFWSEGCHAWATPKDLSKLNQLFLFDTERNITDTGLEKITSGLSPAGTVLLSSRAPIGYLALSAIPIAINQGFIAIRETEYLSAIEAYFWCMANMDLIKSNANGSTFQEISKKNFRPLIYRLAPASIRNAFCKRANPLFARIKLANQQSQTLATLRDTLLPRLMSGKLRVSEAKEMVEEASS